MPRGQVLVRAGMVALLLALVAATVRVPYVALVPGPVTNTLGQRADGVPIITVKGHPTYPTSGQLDLTTVGVSGGPGAQLNLALALRWWFDGHKAVVPQLLLFPPGRTEKQVEQENLHEMEDSQQTAKAAALMALHIPVPTEAVVAAVVTGRPADGVLRRGDVITAVNGTTVTDAAAVRNLLGRVAPGDVVRLRVRRDGNPLPVTVRTVADPRNAQHAIVGIELDERHTFPFQISINLKDVGGPSAGLMFALGIIDKLTPGELNGGRRIAGTGTIAADGTVGPIGGVQQKIVAARRAGARTFLTPVANCAAAVKARPPGLTLVPVRTLAQALDRLAAIRAGRSTPTC